MNLSNRIEKMKNPMYPLSAKYDPQWIISNQMGSHCLWLTESLTKSMDLKPGMRVLDLGCGKALSSIFLAKEFNVEVWAFDLWVGANDNWQRIKEAGVSNLVFPVQGNALEMPFANEFFDAVVSINSIWSYGTDENFVDSQLARVVKPNGQIGIVIPGFFNELTDAPEYLKPYWHPDFNSYHSPDWWRKLWEKAKSIDINIIDAFENKEGSKIWRDFIWILDPDEAKSMEVDDGRNITFLRLLASKR
jgi:ubiquinone/menaquinone biosynthesis C-methylase UbiE